MKKRFWAPVIAAATGASITLAGGSAATAAAQDSPADWTHVRLGDPRIIAHFDYAAGQTVEDFTVAPDGSADLSLSRANEVVHVTRDGEVSTVAQLPMGGSCPALGGSETLGLARDGDETLYVVECSGNADQGVWKLAKGHAPVQIARLPPEGILNDLALDEYHGDLYVTDSLLGQIWKVPTSGAPATLWASGPQLAPTATFFGVNGITVHQDAVWVSNSGQGTILRIPIQSDGSAGAIQAVYSGLAGTGTDNFEVLDRDTVVAAQVFTGDVVLLRPEAQPQVLLTAADGLQNPDDVVVEQDQLYVSSGAYVTGIDPNLLVADINH